MLWFVPVKEQISSAIQRLCHIKALIVAIDALIDVYLLNVAHRLVQAVHFVQTESFSFIRMHTYSRQKLKRKDGVYLLVNSSLKELLLCSMLVKYFLSTLNLGSKESRNTKTQPALI